MHSEYLAPLIKRTEISLGGQSEIGSTKLWNPTEYKITPNFDNPMATFDSTSDRSFDVSIIKRFLLSYIFFRLPESAIDEMLEIAIEINDFYLLATTPESIEVPEQKVTGKLRSQYERPEFPIHPEDV